MQVRAFAAWPKAHHVFILRTPGRPDSELPLQVLRSAVCPSPEADAGAEPALVHVRDGRMLVHCLGGQCLELLQVGSPACLATELETVYARRPYLSLHASMGSCERSKGICGSCSAS